VPQVPNNVTQMSKNGYICCYLDNFVE